MAVFDLAVTKSAVLKTGPSRIVAESAYLSLARGLMPGNSDGLEIMFFEADKRSYAALVLFLDKKNQVWQVNLSYVVPGTTVARTVAWKRDDLERYFSDLQFDGARLVLKSNGHYGESEPGPEAMRISWNVDVNLPVIREVER